MLGMLLKLMGLCETWGSRLVSSFRAYFLAYNNNNNNTRAPQPTAVTVECTLAGGTGTGASHALSPVTRFSSDGRLLIWDAVLPKAEARKSQLACNTALLFQDGGWVPNHDLRECVCLHVGPSTPTRLEYRITLCLIVMLVSGGDHLRLCN